MLLVRVIILSFLTMFILSHPCSAGKNEKFFDRAQEFPNHFLPEHLRNRTGINLHELEAHVKKMEKLLEKAVESRMNNVTLPVIMDGTGKVKQVQYFPELIKRLKKIDSSVEVIASGGVIRSTLGEIYEAVDLGIKRGVSAEDTLKRIGSSKEHVLAHKIRGIGSDWDVLIKTSRKDLFEQMQKVAVEMTNSAEEAFDMAKDRSALKNTLFAFADIKDFEEQMARSVSQGGSTLDFLTFDMERSKFIMPEKHQDIVKQFIKGFYSYIGHAPDCATEMPMKQTVRGIRPLLEIPFLEVENDKLLRKEFEALLKRATQGEVIDGKVYEQFDKMVRNTRAGGAKNRFYRGGPGSLEKMVSKAVKALEKKAERVLIPEFIDSFYIPEAGRSTDGLKKIGISLMDQKRFFQHTNNGRIFHGTSNIENGLAILRQSFFISREGQGTAVYGRGTYVSKDINVAKVYAGDNGLVFKLDFVKDKKLNIVDWSTVSESVKNKLELMAKKEGRDLFEILSRDFGVDVILDNVIMVQNGNVFKRPENIKNIVDAYANMVKTFDGKLSQNVSSYKTFLKVRKFAEVLGYEGLPDSENLKNDLVQKINKELFSSNGRVNFESIEMLLDLGIGDEKPKHYVLKKLSKEFEKFNDLSTFQQKAGLNYYKHYGLVNDQIAEKLITISDNLLGGTDRIRYLDGFADGFHLLLKSPKRKVRFNAVRITPDIKSVDKLITAKVLNELLVDADNMLLNVARTVVNADTVAKRKDRLFAIYSLGKLAPGDENTIKTLRNIYKNAVDKEVKVLAMAATIKNGKLPEEMMEDLGKLMTGEMDLLFGYGKPQYHQYYLNLKMDEIRKLCDDKKLAKIFLSMLSDEKLGNSRLLAAHRLMELGENSKEVNRALWAALKTFPKDPSLSIYLALNGEVDDRMMKMIIDNFSNGKYSKYTVSTAVYEGLQKFLETPMKIKNKTLLKSLLSASQNLRFANDWNEVNKVDGAIKFLNKFEGPDDEIIKAVKSFINYGISESIDAPMARFNISMSLLKHNPGMNVKTGVLDFLKTGINGLEISQEHIGQMLSFVKKELEIGTAANKKLAIELISSLLNNFEDVVKKFDDGKLLEKVVSLVKTNDSSILISVLNVMEKLRMRGDEYFNMFVGMIDSVENRPFLKENAIRAMVKMDYDRNKINSKLLSIVKNKNSQPSVVDIAVFELSKMKNPPSEMVSLLIENYSKAVKNREKLSYAYALGNIVDKYEKSDDKLRNILLKMLDDSSDVEFHALIGLDKWKEYDPVILKKLNDKYAYQGLDERGSRVLLKQKELKKSISGISVPTVKTRPKTKGNCWRGLLRSIVFGR